MRTASCYTNKVKITSYAKNKKVDYPGHIAKNWEVLQATLACNPDFTVQDYVIPACRGPSSCPPPPPPVSPVELDYILQDPGFAPNDPGTGYFTYVPASLPTYTFKISNSTSNSDNASSLLGNMLLGTILTVSKTNDPATSFQIRLTAKTNQTTYWQYTVILLSAIPGSIGIGNSITFTYI
jgi:hypothetical protein